LARSAQLLSTYTEIGKAADSPCGVALVDVATSQLLETSPAQSNARSKITELLVGLFGAKLVSGKEFEGALKDILEFIDDIAIDTPSAYQFAGALFNELTGSGCVEKSFLVDAMPDEAVKKVFKT